MNGDPRKIIVTESSCSACGTHRIEVHHQQIAEFRIRGASAEEATGRLAEQLESSLAAVSDPSKRERVHLAITDIRAFLKREGDPHHARDV